MARLNLNLEFYKRVISPCFALILFAKSYVIRIIFWESFHFCASYLFGYLVNTVVAIMTVRKAF